MSLTKDEQLLSVLSDISFTDKLLQVFSYIDIDDNSPPTPHAQWEILLGERIL